MTVIRSMVVPGGADFQRRRTEMLALVEGFRELEAGVIRHAERARGRFEARGPAHAPGASRAVVGSRRTVLGAVDPRGHLDAR